MLIPSISYRMWDLMTSNADRLYALLQAIQFARGRNYNAFVNNCVQATDFFVRIMTKGAVCHAPLLFDALCGQVPEQDPPMLLLFFLMTGVSWCVSFALLALSKCSFQPCLLFTSGPFTMCIA